MFTVDVFQSLETFRAWVDTRPPAEADNMVPASCLKHISHAFEAPEPPTCSLLHCVMACAQAHPSVVEAVANMCDDFFSIPHTRMVPLAIAAHPYGNRRAIPFALAYIARQRLSGAIPAQLCYTCFKRGPVTLACAVALLNTDGGAVTRKDRRGRNLLHIALANSVGVPDPVCNYLIRRNRLLVVGQDDAGKQPFDLRICKGAPQDLINTYRNGLGSLAAITRSFLVDNYCLDPRPALSFIELVVGSTGVQWMVGARSKPNILMRALELMVPDVILYVLMDACPEAVTAEYTLPYYGVPWLAPFNHAYKDARVKCTALHWAVAYGNAFAVQAIVEKMGPTALTAPAAFGTLLHILGKQLYHTPRKHAVDVDGSALAFQLYAAMPPSIVARCTSSRKTPKEVAERTPYTSGVAETLHELECHYAASRKARLRGVHLRYWTPLSHSWCPASAKRTAKAVIMVAGSSRTRLPQLAPELWFHILSFIQRAELRAPGEV